MQNNPFLCKNTARNTEGSIAQKTQKTLPVNQNLRHLQDNLRHCLEVHSQSPHDYKH